MTPEIDLSYLDPLAVPPEFVHEGDDWLVVFNPTVPRVMDVKLAHKFIHDKCVLYIYSSIFIPITYSHPVQELFVASRHPLTQV
jgi:hypothetical protein